MEKNRSGQVNKIIELLAEITEDESLSYLTKLDDPQNIMNSFRQLWLDYINLTATMLVSFKYVSNNKNSTFWLGKNIHFSKCENCNNSLDIVLHWNTQEMYFNLNVREKIYLVCYCETCDNFVILSVDENIYPEEEIYILNKLIPTTDKIVKEYNVPVIDTEGCDMCPAMSNLKMGKITINESTQSKIGGLKTSIERTKYKVKQYSKCKCQDSSKIIFSLKGLDCEILRIYEILALEASQCEKCKNIYFDIYSHQLISDYNMDLFSNKDKFYHIINSDDELNGVIIETNYDIKDINICCKLTNYVRNNTGIDFILLKVIPKTIIKLLNDNFDYNILKNIPLYLSQDMKKLQSQKEIELLTIPDIQTRYGKNFYISSTLKQIPLSLVEVNNNELVYHGFFEDESYTNLVQYKPKQLLYIYEIGAKNK